VDISVGSNKGAGGEPGGYLTLSTQDNSPDVTIHGGQKIQIGVGHHATDGYNEVCIQPGVIDG
jgi:hypothetical protein